MGLRARELTRLSEFQVAPGYCEERISIYLARGLESCSQRLDDDEEIEVVRLPFAEALAKVHSGEIDDAKTIITLLLAAPLAAQAQQAGQGGAAGDLSAARPLNRIVSPIDESRLVSLSGTVSPLANAANDRGDTPMHAAAERGADEIVQFLADHGATSSK